MLQRWVSNYQRAGCFKLLGFSFSLVVLIENFRNLFQSILLTKSHLSVQGVQECSMPKNAFFKEFLLQ